jgi:hypothetical protein
MIHDPQELARQFNEDEAVWRSFEEKRRVRRLLGSPSLLSEELLDALDWSKAERETKRSRAIGKWIAP